MLCCAVGAMGMSTPHHHVCGSCSPSAQVGQVGVGSLQEWGVGRRPPGPHGAGGHTPQHPTVHPSGENSPLGATRWSDVTARFAPYSQLAGRGLQGHLLGPPQLVMGT